MKQAMRFHLGLIWIVLLLAGPCLWGQIAEDSERALAILEATGIKGGLIVHLGAGDGRLTAALRANDAYLVHGLDADGARVEKARAHVRSLGLYGPVSIDRLRGGRLPHVDYLANLVVVEDLGGIPMPEVMRVLAPGGAAYVKQGSAWEKTIKPQPDNMDDWTHYLHDATGNAVAADEHVAPPKHIRWAAGPLWSRSHEFNPSMNALVSGGGRMFYIFDDGMSGLPDLRFPARWALYGRDAFSGKLLWKRPVPNWGYREWNTRGMWSAPLTLNRRVVTDGRYVFVTLGYQAPVTVLEAPTGRNVRTIADSMGTDEMILVDGVLLLCVREKLSVAAPPKQEPPRRLNPHEWTIDAPGPAAVVAVEAETGRELWRTEPQAVSVLTLAADEGRICFHSDNELVCLDLKTGQRHWSKPLRGLRGNRHARGTLVMHDGVVLFAGGDGLQAFSTNNGEHLWTGPKVSGPGVTHPPDLFVADGLVWGGYPVGSHYKDRTAVWREGRNLKTGKVERTIAVGNLISPLHHFRCYRSKATENYLLLTKRGVEFVNLQGQDHMRHDWLRGMCHYGFTPCNGLLYVPPHHCFCYPGVKLTGFLALAGGESDGVDATGEAGPRLERGPAFGQIDPPSRGDGSTDDWPTYRRDPLRSGHVDTSVSTDLKQAWRTKLGGKITPPVMADGRIYLAQTDTHQIHCLDAATGAALWSHTAGARVDSPPTLHGGRVLFGCRDGWVYCLRAADGQLAWRFRAAPDDRRIVSFEQIESPWPVPGSVLVLDDVAYVTAGHSSFLDGGIHLYGLNPRTGELLCQTRVDGPWPEVNTEIGRPFDMEGTKSDILVTDGNHIFLYQMAFDKQLNDVTPPRTSDLGDRVMARHLIATGGFLEDVWYDRTYWSYSNRWPGFYYANAAPKAGQILVFDDETTYGLHVFTERLRLSPAFTPGGDGYELFADDNDNEPVLASNAINREKGAGFSRAAPPKWSKRIPLRSRAMVLADDKLFLAGMPDVVPGDDPYAAFEGRRGAQLWVVSAADGAKLSEYSLDHLPAFDGLIAARGRLYLVTTDGYLVCFAGPETLAVAQNILR
jgi:outer membrane protein assembly factor BamB